MRKLSLAAFAVALSSCLRLFFFYGFELSERRIQPTLLHWRVALRPSAAIARSGCGLPGLGLDAAADCPTVTRILVYAGVTAQVGPQVSSGINPQRRYQA